MVLKFVDDHCETHDLKALCISENGSKAWGYDSYASDYDVKVLYRHHNQEAYKNLTEPAQVFTNQADELHDFTYWDIRKFLQLLWQGNAQTYELLFSPIIYKEEDDIQLLRDFSHNVLTECIRSVAYHYYGLAHKTYKQRIAETGEPTTKKYLYVIRPLMHVDYILRENRLPSLDFEECFEWCDIFDLHHREMIYEILSDKRSGREMKDKRYDELDKLFEDKIPLLKDKLESFAIRETFEFRTEEKFNSMYKFLAFQH